MQKFFRTLPFFALLFTIIVCSIFGSVANAQGNGPGNPNPTTPPAYYNTKCPDGSVIYGSGECCKLTDCGDGVFAPCGKPCPPLTCEEEESSNGAVSSESPSLQSSQRVSSNVQSSSLQVVSSSLRNSSSLQVVSSSKRVSSSQLPASLAKSSSRACGFSTAECPGEADRLSCESCCNSADLCCSNLCDVMPTGTSDEIRRQNDCKAACMSTTINCKLSCNK